MGLKRRDMFNEWRKMHANERSKSQSGEQPHDMNLKTLSSFFSIPVPFQKNKYTMASKQAGHKVQAAQICLRNQKRFSFVQINT